MGSYTPNLGLYKPSVGENGWGTTVDNNWDILDGLGLTGPFAPDAELASSTSVGATTFTVNGVPSGMMGSRGAVVTIDGGTDLAETRQIYSLSGSVFTVELGLRFAHSSGAPIFWHRTNVVSPIMYNASPLINSDDSMRLQRWMLDNYTYDWILDGACARSAHGYQIQQPLIAVNSVKLQNLSMTQNTGWTAGAGVVGDLFMLMYARNQCTFTASASTDTFTASNNQGMVADGKMVILNDPYSAGFPGGVTQGKTYYMVNTSGDTFKIATTVGGSAVNVTSDGAGWMYGNTTSDCKVYLNNIFLQLTLADVGGIHVCVEQPGYMYNIDVEMDVDASAYTVAANNDSRYIFKAIGIHVDTFQYVNAHNWEINPSANCLGIDVSGTGLVVADKITMNSFGAGMQVTGSDHHFLGGFLLERVHHPFGIRRYGTMRNVTIGNMYFSAENTTDPLFQDDYTGSSGSSSRQLGGQVATTNALLFKSGDGSYSDKTSWDGNTPGLGMTEEAQQVWGPVTQTSSSAGAFGSWRLDEASRRVTVVAVNWTFRENTKTYYVHANSLTGTLHSAAGMDGHRYTIRPEPGVTGTTIDGAGSETINGSLTYSVPAGGVTIEAYSGNWLVVV